MRTISTGEPSTLKTYRNIALALSFGNENTEVVKFFDDKTHDYPMHLEIYYSKICDWRIYIYKQGCGENDKDLEICFVQDGDMELAFAKAYVQLKEWLIENNGGY